MKKKLAVIIALLLVIAIVIGITVSNLKFRGDLTEISSEKQLQKIVDGYNYSGGSTVLATFICPLIALPTRSFSGGIIEDASSSQSSGGGIVPSEITSSASDTKSFDSVLPSINKGTTTSDYSTTNIQVENVDEADIVKTDGEYVYSISDDTVYITYAKNPTEMNIVAKIEEPLSNVYPEDLILQNNKLIIISGNTIKTVVKIYDLADIENPDKIKDVIGRGGDMITKIICEASGVKTVQDKDAVKVDLEDDGRVIVYHNDKSIIDKTIKMIQDIAREVEIGKVYKVKVVSVQEFGLFVELWPGCEGLIHVSQLDIKRVGKPSDIANVGDELLAIATGYDKKGKLNLSRKELLKKNVKINEEKK